MKKGLVGCLVVGLVILVLGAGAAYWFVLRPMWSAGSAMVSGAQDFSKVADLEKSVQNQSPFTAPADGLITSAQAKSFVAIQQVLIDALGKDFDTLKQKYDAIEAQNRQAGKEADLTQVMGAYSDMSGLMLKAKQAQVDGINQQGLSLDEYRWIRAQAYAALPYINMTPEQVQQMDQSMAAAPAAPASVDTSHMTPEMQKALADNAAAMAQAQAQLKAMNESPEMKAGRANADLLRPNKELIMKTLGVAWLGM